MGFLCWFSKAKGNIEIWAYSFGDAVVREISILREAPPPVPLLLKHSGILNG